MPEKHAILSASSAARWIRCPPSARLCESIPDTVSTFAAEGTLAHEICEVKLNAFITPIPKRTVNTKLDKLKKSELYAPEMDGYTDTYIDYIKKMALSFPTKAIVSAEKQVDFSNYAPEGFGTSDCLIVHGDDLYVIDFKYGKGVMVPAEDNPQMKLYALGAINLYGMFYPIKNIHLSIIQPRLDNISEWCISIDDLVNWGKKVKEIAKLAYVGEGEMESGEHCKFCKIKATCHKRAEDNLALAKYQFAKPTPIAKENEPTLSDTEVGDILVKAQQLKKWVKDLEDYALNALLNDKEIQGWKAVEGRGSRNWTSDTDAIIQRLGSLNYPSDIAYERKTLSVAQLEKIIGTTDFTNFSDLYEKTKGKPTLVPMSDKRSSYTQGTSANEDFKNN
jgi:hypothetical protein